MLPAGQVVPKLLYLPAAMGEHPAIECRPLAEAPVYADV
jgi:hypothetical protein